MKTKKKKRLGKRAIVSLTLLFTAIMMPVSVWIAHAAQGATDSYMWLHLHGLFGVLFLVFCIFHINYNRRALMYYLGFGKRNKE